MQLVVAKSLLSVSRYVSHPNQGASNFIETLSGESLHSVLHVVFIFIEGESSEADVKYLDQIEHEIRVITPHLFSL